MRASYGAQSSLTRQGLATTASLTGFLTSGVPPRAGARQLFLGHAARLQSLLQSSSAQGPDERLTSKARVFYCFQLRCCQRAVRDTGRTAWVRTDQTHTLKTVFAMNKLFPELDNGRLHFASLWKNPRIPKCLHALET